MVTARSLSPGEEGTIEVTFDSTKRSGDQENTVRITTNDPDNETVVLTIKAHVITPLHTEPQVARIGESGQDEERTVRLKLLVEDPEQVQDKRISSSSPDISGRMTVEPTHGVEGELEIRMAPGRPLGKFEEKIILHTTSQIMPRLEVQIVGEILGDLRLEPAAIGFQSSGPPDPKASPLEVLVSSAGGRSFRVTALEDETGFLQTGIIGEQPGTVCRISIQIKTGGSEPVPANFRGVLKILTDRPDQPILELPVYRAGRNRPTGPRAVNRNQM